MTENKALAEQIEDLLPQTQCTKCGYPDCRAYAKAISEKEASYNQCPPGGQEGVARLANLLGQPLIPLNTSHGAERSLHFAVIDEALCIGCTLCIQACPVDAIVGAPKMMHTVLPAQCTGCDLCVAPCPVDCISMVPVSEQEKSRAASGRAAQGRATTGWAAWSQAQADAARNRHDLRTVRLELEKQENEVRLRQKAQEKLRVLQEEILSSPEAAAEQARKKAIIEAAIARAKITSPKS